MTRSKLPLARAKGAALVHEAVDDGLKDCGNMIDAPAIVEARFFQHGVALDGVQNFCGDLAFVFHQNRRKPDRLPGGSGKTSLDLGNQFLDIRGLGEEIVHLTLDGANRVLQAGIAGEDEVFAARLGAAHRCDD